MRLELRWTFTKCVVVKNACDVSFSSGAKVTNVKPREIRICSENELSVKRPSSYLKIMSPFPAAVAAGDGVPSSTEITKIKPGFVLWQ